jgi:hypothetical protein
MVSPGSNVGAIDLHLKAQPLYTVRFKASSPPCKSSSLQLFDIVRRSSTGATLMAGIVLSSATVPSRFEAVAANANLRNVEGDSWISPGLSPGEYDIDFSSCFNSMPFGPENFGHMHVQVVDRDVDSGAMDVRVVGAPLIGHVSLAPSAASQVDLQKILVQPVDLEHRSPFLFPSGGRSMGIPGLGVPASDGTFSLQRVVPGRYALTIRGLPKDVYIESIRTGGLDVRDVGFDFNGQPAGPVEITLNDMAGSVSGVIENSRHDPVVNALVVLVPARARRENITLFKTMMTDQTGQFEIRGITPGDYTAFAFEDIEPRAYLNSEFLDKFEGRGMRLQVERASAIKTTIAVIMSQ